MTADESELIAVYRKLDFVRKVSVIDRAKLLWVDQMDGPVATTAGGPSRAAPARTRGRIGAAHYSPAGARGGAFFSRLYRIEQKARTDLGYHASL